MSREAPSKIDVDLAHRHFSAECFNRTWALIEKDDRTAADTEAMVLCALASLWHWTQRGDRTDRDLSVGHWQVARVYALAGQGANAMLHAQRSLELAKGAPPFYVGYAHEAIARAALLLNDREGFQAHLNRARDCTDAVAEADERQPLQQDLRLLESSGVPAA